MSAPEGRSFGGIHLYQLRHCLRPTVLRSGKCIRLLCQTCSGFSQRRHRKRTSVLQRSRRSHLFAHDLRHTMRDQQCLSIIIHPRRSDVGQLDIDPARQRHCDSRNIVDLERLVRKRVADSRTNKIEDCVGQIPDTRNLAWEPVDRDVDVIDGIESSCGAAIDDCDRNCDCALASAANAETDIGKMVWRVPRQICVSSERNGRSLSLSHPTSA